MTFLAIGFSLYWLCKKNKESDSNIYAILFWVEIVILIALYLHIDAYIHDIRTVKYLIRLANPAEYGWEEPLGR